MTIRIPAIPLAFTSVLACATLLMEAMWFYLWMVWLGSWSVMGLGEVPLTLPSILLLLGTSYYAVRAVGQQRGSQLRSQVMAAGVSTIAILLVTRLEHGGSYALWDIGWIGFATRSISGVFPSAIQASLLGGVYLWWRGYRLAVNGFHPEQVLHSFLVGLVGIVLGVLAWEAAIRSAGTFEASRSQAMAITLTFFVAALAALAISHLVSVRATIAQLEGADAPLSQRWSAVLLWVILGMLVAGGAVSALLSLDIWSWVPRVLSLLSYGFAFVVYYLMLPIAYLMALLIYGVQWLLSRRHAEPVSLRIPDFSAIRPTNEPVASEGVALWVIVLKWTIVLLIVALVIFLLARMLASRRRRPDSSHDLSEIHESVGSWKDIVQDFLAGIMLLVSWFQRRSGNLAQRVHLQTLLKGERPEHEMEVRELYGRMLAEARSAGFPRKEHETPGEYLATLERRLPSEREALERITQDYVRVRYGEEDVAADEKGLLNRLWRKLYTAIRKPEPPRELQKE